MAEDTPMQDDNDTEAQWAQLQAENERLRAQLEQAGARVPKGSRLRRTTSLILVVLAVVVVVAGVFASWLQTTIADEERFVDTFAPLPKDQAVAAVLSNRLADQLITQGGVAERIERALPSDLAFLAAPVTEGIHNLTTDTAEGIITSDAFLGIWQGALRVTHVTASAVLSTGGKVAIDLNDAADEIVAALEERGVGVLSGIELELSEIVVFESEQIAAIAAPLEVIDTMGWLVPLIALLLIAGALWVSPDRRRTTTALGFGTALGLMLTLVIIRLIRVATASSIEDESVRAAAEAVWDTTLRFYLQSMWALVILGVIVGIVAWLTGPSAHASGLRTGWNRTLGRWQNRGGEAPMSGVAEFFATWRRPLQWGTLGIGLLFLLFGPNPSVWSVIVPTFVVIVVIAGIEIIAGPQPSSSR